MIGNRKITVAAALITLAACLFTLVFLLWPQSLHITAASSSPDYLSLFDPMEVLSVEITVDEDQWEQMLENAIDEEYISCDVTVNGTEYTSVGIRPKGNSSLSTVYQSDSDRYSFKLEFDHYVDGQTCQGLDKFVLNNMQSDPTYVKEYLSYDLMAQMGVPTPLYCFAQIQVNGEPWGLYLAVEALEESFAQRQYGTDHGDLYKPDTMEMGGGAGGGAPGDAPDGFGDMERPGGENATEGAENGGGMAGFGGEAPFDGGLERPDDGGGGGPNGSGGGADLQYIDEDPDSYSAIFDGAVFDIDETDKARLVESLRKLSQGEDLEEVVDVDEVLRYFACNAALVNLDSYLGTMQHNYYLYEDEGQLSMLPWDYNLSFAAFQVGGASAAVNFPIDTPVSGTTLEERPILGKLLEEPEYLEQYHTYLAQIAAYWAPDSFAQKLAALDALIGDYVKEDPTAFYSYEEYQQGLAMLQTYVELRVQSIEGQLDGTIPSTEEGQQQDSSNLVDASAIDLAVMGQQGGGGGGGPAGWQNGGEAMGGPVDAQTFGRTAGSETGESTTPAEDSTGSAGQGAEAAQRQAADPAEGQAAPEGSSAPTEGQAAPEQRTAPPQNRAAASPEGREGFQLAGATGEDGASAAETGSLASLGACVAAVAGALVFAGRYQRKKR